jgi:hypothetical protein
MLEIGLLHLKIYEKPFPLPQNYRIGSQRNNNLMEQGYHHRVDSPDWCHDYHGCPVHNFQTLHHFLKYCTLIMSSPDTSINWWCNSMQKYALSINTRSRQVLHWAKFPLHINFMCTIAPEWLLYHLFYIILSTKNDNGSTKLTGYKMIEHPLH